jgi:hypothetical protein
MEVTGQLHAPAALLPGKSPRYPLDRRLGGHHSRSGPGGEEKKSYHCPRRELNPGRPAHLYNANTRKAPTVTHAQEDTDELFPCCITPRCKVKAATEVSQAASSSFQEQLDSFASTQQQNKTAALEESKYIDHKCRNTCKGNTKHIQEMCATQSWEL